MADQEAAKQKLTNTALQHLTFVVSKIARKTNNELEVYLTSQHYLIVILTLILKIFN